MIIVKKGKRFFFGLGEGGGERWGERKALAKKYNNLSEVPNKYKNKEYKLVSLNNESN